MTKYQKIVAMLFLAGSWVTLVITRLVFFVSEELTTRNNALHFSYILKIVKILQDCLIQFAIGPAVNTLGAFLMKVGARSHSLDYYNQYAVSFYVSINKLNSSGNFCNGTTFPIMLGIILVSRLWNPLFWFISNYNNQEVLCDVRFQFN